MKIILLLLISQIFGKTFTWEVPESTLPEDDEKLEIAIDFARQRLYDESYIILQDLSIERSYDPAAYLFYISVCEYTFLKKKECIEHLEKLLEREEDIPVRFANVGKLMLNDIKDLEGGSLDEIARIMNDVERRLDLARAGEITRNEEQLIIDKLDKLIKQVEDQQKQQQESNSNAESESQGKSSKQKGFQPLDKSEIQEEKGNGDVDRKENESYNWGNLPDKERQESLQRMSETLPSHYRDIIEGYFRSLSKEEN